MIKKSTLCLVLSLFLGNLSYGYSKKTKDPKSPSPPGTIYVSDNFYADQFEVSNFNWLEYLNWLKKNNNSASDIYKKALPDTTVWADTSYQKNYLRTPSFRNHPVVGITYEQAIDFCEWRSDRVNEFFYIKENKSADLKTAQIPVVVTYRLPTEAEWEHIYAINLPKNKNKLYNYEVNANLKNEKNTFTQSSELNRRHNIPYNHLIGNVAEMVAKKGTAKGGSWQHTAKQAASNATQLYSSPQNWLGFRCVCDIKK